ncbi:MAG: hypothetical protein OEL20_12000 [Sulfuritalea sp.]|nr:hypothetical protein [Sulfuritalea sp.]
MTHVAFLAGLGWRDVVLLLAATSGVYLVLSVMRLFEITAKRNGSLQPASGPGFSAWEPRSAAQMQAPQPRPLAPELARMLEQAKIRAELQRLRSDNTRLHEVLANVAEDVARLKAARRLQETMAPAPDMPGGQRNYRPLRHLQRRGATVPCANAQSYALERHQQGEDYHARTIDTGSRSLA